MNIVAGEYYFYFSYFLV